MATRTYRPETYVWTQSVADVQADEDFTFDIPAGVYELAILTDTPTVLAVGTAVITCRAFANAAQTRVVETDFFMAQTDETTSTLSMTLTIGDTSQYATIFRFDDEASGSRVPLPYGLQVTYDQTGGNMTGALNVTLVASRVG